MNDFFVKVLLNEEVSIHHKILSFLVSLLFILDFVFKLLIVEVAMSS